LFERWNERELYFCAPAMKTQKARFNLFLFILLSVFGSGCGVLRNIPANEYLLDKNIIKTDYPEFKENLTSIIKQKPNRRILYVFRFHLGVYFMANRGKETKIKNYLKTAVGEEPVLLDTNLTNKSKQQLEIFMQNNGYFNAIAKDSIVRKKTTCKVYYLIESGKPYSFLNMKYLIPDSILKEVVLKDTIQTLIKSGTIFSNTTLQKERDRISSNIRNHGYYYFTPQYITFKIDSSLHSNKVNIILKIANPQNIFRDKATSNNDYSYHKKSTFKKVYIEMEYDPISDKNKSFQDTIKINDYYFLSNNNKEFLYKPKKIIEQIFINPDSLFSQANIDLTYRRLADLSVFKFINTKFEPLIETDNSKEIPLICNILLSPSPRQDYKLEAEVTNSGGNLGLAGNITYKNKNIFGGAESFDFRIKGGLELQRNFSDTTFESQKIIPIFNAYELGPDVTLNFPRFLGFDIINTEINNKNTSINVGYNIQNRLEYFRQLLNVSFFWSARYGKYTRLFLYPAELNFLKVKLDPVFEQQLISLNDPNILIGYKDQLIANGQTSIIYSNQELNKSKFYSYIRGNLEYAGNSINLFTNNTTIFNVNYAQYIRPDFDYRHYITVRKTNTLVFRFGSGLGYAYGNSVRLPFEKSFFAGGPNDIRAWKSRSIGPGSSQKSDVYEQFGEIKIQSNLEYRFGIFRKLKGAWFTDAGNIWLLRPVEEIPGGTFKFNSFLDEIAIGTGLGLRFDFTFFIIRLDGAIKLKDPSLTKGERWVFNVQKINDITFNFGIGYPF